MAYAVLVACCTFLLGVCIGFMFNKPIQKFITGLSDDSEISEEEEDLWEEPCHFEWDDDDFLEDDKGKMVPHPANIVELAMELSISMPSPEQKDECYHYNIAYKDIFDDDSPKHEAMTFRYTDFSDEEMSDPHFESYVQYLCMARLWNRVAASYPEQLPHMARTDSSLNLPFEDLHGYIHGDAE